jgi:hypothetical protein
MPALVFFHSAPPSTRDCQFECHRDDVSGMSALAVGSSAAPANAVPIDSAARLANSAGFSEFNVDVSPMLA